MVATTDEYSQPIIEHQYAEAWRQYRLRLTILVGLFVSYLPAMIGFKFFFDEIFSDGDTPTMIAAFCWMAAYGIAGWRFGCFRCPRCREDFFNRKAFAFIRFYQPFAKKCWNCGLEKWAGE